MDFTPQPSYSSIGRTADAKSAQQHKNTKHTHKVKVHLKPWDGMELVDKILLDARKSHECNPRTQICLSSPRVNPAMVEKVFVEETTAKMAMFLSATATSLGNLPAHRTILLDGRPEDSDDSRAGEPNTPFTFRKRKTKKVRPKQSAAFLAPTRKGPAEPTTGPPVGKYQPKFTCIERRSTTPIIPRADTIVLNRSSQESPARTPERQKHSHDENASESNNNPSLGGTLRSGSLSQTLSLHPGSPMLPLAMPAAQEGESLSRFPTKHGLQDTSSAFKSKQLRFPASPSSLDLCYYPYTYPGQTTYAQGPFHGNARARPYTPHGKPCGALVSYPLPDQRAKTALDFTKIVPRDKLKTRMLFTPLDTSNIDHDPNISALSTKPRAAQVPPMAKQTARPSVPDAVAGEDLGPYVNSMATAKKKGFVEIRRMMYNHLAPPYELDAAQQAAVLARRTATPIDTSVLQTQAPKYSFPKGPRDNIAAHATVNDLSYNTDASPGRHRPPACFMPMSERLTMAKRTVNDVVYDVNESLHTPTCNIGKQISRDVRDKRFAS